ncbi:hypothetical protein BE08_44935 [Sorangium cellulosum]|uniref:Uncharacterized protein n=1 Tax=Sorangium cellulosum TaxID=56 RepID=A0A150PJ86_SORCE|nr:hypothetical protein BE08_44935 [Sorangium cellulosum]
MGRVTWGAGNVIDVETRRGLFVLAQMCRSPYLVFFRHFRRDRDWQGTRLAPADVLFCTAVTRQFLRSSTIGRVKGVAPLNVDLPTVWIHPDATSRRVTVWEGTPHERSFITIGRGGALVRKDVNRHAGGPFKHPSGVFDEILEPSIVDIETIEGHELTSIAVFPLLQERLFLCHGAGKSVDPEKHLLFDLPMPLAFEPYIELIAASTEEERRALQRRYVAG